MKFLLSQELIQGRYIVNVTLKEFTDDDVTKAKIFGMPTLNIRVSDGRTLPIPISSLNQTPVFSFRNAEEAERYAIQLKEQMQTLKTKWDNLKDSWSKQEEI
jgi:hypothetical protein